MRLRHHHLMMLVLIGLVLIFKTDLLHVEVINEDGENVHDPFDGIRDFCTEYGDHLIIGLGLALGISLIVQERPHRSYSSWPSSDSDRWRPPPPARCRYCGKTESEVKALGYQGNQSKEVLKWIQGQGFNRVEMETCGYCGAPLKEVQ